MHYACLYSSIGGGGGGGDGAGWSNGKHFAHKQIKQILNEEEVNKNTHKWIVTACARDTKSRTPTQNKHTSCRWQWWRLWPTICAYRYQIITYFLLLLLMIFCSVFFFFFSLFIGNVAIDGQAKEASRKLNWKAKRTRHLMLCFYFVLFCSSHLFYSFFFFFFCTFIAAKMAHFRLKTYIKNGNDTCALTESNRIYYIKMVIMNAIWNP